MIGKGYEQGFMSDQEAAGIMAQALEKLDLAGKRLLMIIPDTTRTAPMPLITTRFSFRPLVVMGCLLRFLTSSIITRSVGGSHASACRDCWGFLGRAIRRASS